jgi:hypothetical protein
MRKVFKTAFVLTEEGPEACTLATNKAIEDLESHGFEVVNVTPLQTDLLKPFQHKVIIVGIKLEEVIIEVPKGTILN